MSIYRANKDGTANPSSGTCVWMSGTERGTAVNQSDHQDPGTLGGCFTVHTAIRNPASPLTNELKIKVTCGTFDAIHQGTSSDAAAGGVTTISGECTNLRNHTINNTGSTATNGRCPVRRRLIWNSLHQDLQSHCTRHAASPTRLDSAADADHDADDGHRQSWRHESGRQFHEDGAAAGRYDRSASTPPMPARIMGKQWLSLQASPPVSSALIWGATSFFGTSGTITDPFGTGSGPSADGTHQRGHGECQARLTRRSGI